MAPKTKVPKEKILDTALTLLIQEGHESINIKRLAQELGCSTQPISWSFGSMEQLRTELTRYAREYFNSKVFSSGDTPLDTFRRIPRVCLTISYEEPNLMRFMRITSNRFMTKGGIETLFDPRLNGDLVAATAQELNVSTEDALRFVQTMVIYVQGISSFIVTDSIEISYDEAMNLICGAAAMCLNISQEEARRLFYADDAQRITA